MSRLDQVARELGAGMPRRGLLGWLIAFVLGGLLSPWRKQETVEGRGRRKRRKKRHKHGQPRPHGKRQRRKRRKKGATCQQGQPCGEPGQICQSDGTCACPGIGCGGVCGCEAGFICDEGACQPCDVIFDGDSVTSGATLQARMEPPGGTIRVCPGRYQHNFLLNRPTNVVVIGAGDGEDEASSTILDAGGSGRTLTINQYATASLRGVRITGGDDTLGGGIRNDGGLTLTACTVSGNDANLGGALYYSNAATGSLALIDCRLTDNDANRGAGIDNNSILAVTLSGCTISKNRSVQDGAGIYNNGGALDITDCEINENEAQGNGGG
ncbi:MAG: right-handed parallel beta-helix repeat-containing protein, partial [Chloroflexota bacterium]|nr:right-handed parallel beta-helix repeat-containing protein [Chloroflexota bacterium]